MDLVTSLTTSPQLIFHPQPRRNVLRFLGCVRHTHRLEDILSVRSTVFCGRTRLVTPAPAILAREQWVGYTIDKRQL
jgi:hypothetical protein